jgi:hypothetical protein
LLQLTLSFTNIITIDLIARTIFIVLDLLNHSCEFPHDQTDRLVKGYWPFVEATMSHLNMTMTEHPDLLLTIRHAISLSTLVWSNYLLFAQAASSRSSFLNLLECGLHSLEESWWMEDKVNGGTNSEGQL